MPLMHRACRVPARRIRERPSPDDDATGDAVGGQDLHSESVVGTFACALSDSTRHPPHFLVDVVVSIKRRIKKKNHLITFYHQH